MKGVINIDQERCKGCALCIEFCPKKIIYLSNRLNAKGILLPPFRMEMNVRVAPHAL